ncbi:hypothetical protein CR513_09344, partial [Mucuna pruriens]
MVEDKDINVQINSTTNYLKNWNCQNLRLIANNIDMSKYPCKNSVCYCESKSFDYQGKFGGRQTNSKKNPTLMLLTQSSRKRKTVVYEKSGHHAPRWRYRVARNDNPPKPKANMTEGNDIIVAIIFQVNIVTNKCLCVLQFCGDGEEMMYHGDSRTALVLGKGKIRLKLTFSETLALSNVLHVSSIRVNLVLVALLRRVGVKMSFELDKIVITKNNGYYDKGLFVLSISKTISENASSSSYMIDSYDIWHAKLGHTNSLYAIQLQQLGLINLHDI